MKKRILAVLLTAMLAVSVAACNKDDDTGSKTESTSETAPSQVTSTQGVELDARIKDSVESVIGADVLGDKTKGFINKFLSDELDVSISMAIPETDEESSRSALTIPSDYTVSFGFAKNADNAVRVNLDMGLIKLDMLGNKEGTYIINSDEKTATFTKAQDQQSSAAESSVSDSSAELPYGIKKGSIKNAGEGEEKFGDGTYSYEAYSVTYDPSAASGMAALAGGALGGTSGEESHADEEMTVKLYFDGDNIKGFSFQNSTAQADLIVDKFSTTADASLFTIPSDYEITEDSSGLGFLSMFGGNTGTASSDS